MYIYRKYTHCGCFLWGTTTLVNFPPTYLLFYCLWFYAKFISVHSIVWPKTSQVDKILAALFYQMLQNHYMTMWWWLHGVVVDDSYSINICNITATTATYCTCSGAPTSWLWLICYHSEPARVYVSYIIQVKCKGLVAKQHPTMSNANLFALLDSLLHKSI